MQLEQVVSEVGDPGLEIPFTKVTAGYQKDYHNRISGQFLNVYSPESKTFKESRVGDIDFKYLMDHMYSSEFGSKK